MHTKEPETQSDVIYRL